MEHNAMLLLEYILVTFLRSRKIYSTSTYTENTENAITGFRPIRSAMIPQKTDARPLPIIYDAPKEKGRNI